MRFGAILDNSGDSLHLVTKVGEKEQSIALPAKPSGGSSVSGGELLMLALATCYCNDIYREAAKRRISIKSVEVEVMGDFEAEGRAATNLVYSARIKADADDETVRELMQQTDTVAEIHNTLRAGIPVRLELKKLRD